MRFSFNCFTVCFFFVSIHNISNQHTFPTDVCFRKFASLFIYPSSIHCPAPINCPAPISSSLYPLHCPVPPYTVLLPLYSPVLTYIVLHGSTLSCIPLHCPVLFTLSCTPLHCPVLPYTVLHPLHWSASPYTVLYPLTLSCTPYTILYSLHCLVLHTVLNSLIPPYTHYTVLYPFTLLHFLVASSQSPFLFPCHIRYCVPLSSIELLFNSLLPSALRLYAPLTFILKYTHACIHCKLRPTYENELCFLSFCI